MSGPAAPGARPALRDPGPVAAALIAFALLWLALFLVLPLVVVVVRRRLCVLVVRGHVDELEYGRWL